MTWAFNKILDSACATIQPFPLPLRIYNGTGTVLVALAFTTTEPDFSAVAPDLAEARSLLSVHDGA